MAVASIPIEALGNVLGGAICGGNSATNVYVSIQSILFYPVSPRIQRLERPVDGGGNLPSNGDDGILQA
jgi:hypothetical protein